VHPEILDSFEAGWNALGTDMQQEWQAFGHDYNPAWRSWAHVAFVQIRREFVKKRGKPVGYRDLLEFAHDEVANLISSKLTHSGSLFGLPNIPGTQDICDDVSRLVTEIIVRKEVGGFIERLKEETERDGLIALRKYLSEYKVEGMQSSQ
jgi:hypothetical protein